MDSSLQKLASATDVVTQNKIVQTFDLRVNGQFVQVQIHSAVDRLERVVQIVTQTGGKVTKTSKVDGLLQAWVPVDALDYLASSLDIYQIRSPTRLVLSDLEVGVYIFAWIGSVLRFSSTLTVWL